MSARKKNIAKEDLEGLHDSLCKLAAQLGWHAPITEAQVAAAEQTLAGIGRLPPALRDPQAVLAGPARTPRLATLSGSPTELGAVMARAARKGSALPPDVAETMRLDRQKAERAAEQSGELHGPDVG